MDSLTSFFAFFDNSSLLNGVLTFLGTVLGLPYIYLQYKASPKFLARFGRQCAALHLRQFGEE